MPNSVHFKKLPRFGTVLFTLSLSALTLGLVIGALTLLRYSSQLENSVQSEGVQRGSHALQVAMNAIINREWDSLRAVATTVDLTSEQSMTNFVNAVPRASDRIAWVGVVAPSGRVLAGSNGMQVGENMGMTQWFQSGLQKNTVALSYETDRTKPDLSRDALMLAQPVMRNGEPQAVLVYQMRLSALSDYMRQVASDLNIDAYIVTPSGQVVMGTASSGKSGLSADEVAVIRQGITSDGVVKVGASSDDLMSVAAWSSGGKMPHIPWKLVVLSSDHFHSAALQGARLTAVLTYLGLGAVVAMVLGLWISSYARQIAKLSAVSVQMAKGEQVFPPEYSSTREASQLSSSLVQMQTQISDLQRLVKKLRKTQSAEVLPFPAALEDLRKDRA